MIVTSTPTIEGRPVSQYIGLVTGYSALGATDSMLLVAVNGTAVKLG